MSNESSITVTLEDGSEHVYRGRMADHSLLFLASTGFLDDLVDMAFNESRNGE